MQLSFTLIFNCLSQNNNQSPIFSFLTILETYFKMSYVLRSLITSICLLVIIHTNMAKKIDIENVLESTILCILAAGCTLNNVGTFLLTSIIVENLSNSSMAIQY